MDGYNEKSCNALEKPFYRPIEAAIRWCGLIAHEAAILQAMGGEHIPQVGQFPRWPCLHANTMKILDAVMNGGIPHGRDGRNVDDHVAPARRTVRHTDLREWMAKHYPDQKPAFLFDEIERGAHSAISTESYRILKAAHDTKEQKLSQALERISQLEKEKSLAGFELQGLRSTVEKMSVPGDRSEKTYQNIIAALLACIAGHMPNVEKHPSFESEAKLIDAIDDHFRGFGGLSKSNLSRKFPEAKKSMQAQ